MTEQNLLSEIAALCLEVAKEARIPKKIILGNKKMEEAYKILTTQIVNKGYADEHLSYDMFKKGGCQLNIGYGAIIVEFAEGDPDFIKLESVTEDQLLKQAERDASKYISEENKLKRQGRD